MADDTKVIYLKKDNGQSIKAYVVDYLFDAETEKIYVIIVDQNGKNAKGFQIIDEEAIILSTKESSLFKGYQDNSKFKIVTDQYIDGMSFDLVKEHQELNFEELAKNAEPIVYYVYDEGKLNSYKADLVNTQKGERILFNICFLKNFDHVEREKVEEIAKSGEHQEIVYIIYDKQKDLDFRKNGTVLLLNFEKIEEKSFVEDAIDETKLKMDKNLEVKIEEPETFNFSETEKLNNSYEEEKQIIFYLYDQDVVKKYRGSLISEEAHQIGVHFVEALGMIQNIDHLSFQEFLNHKDIEAGAYLAHYDDYNSSIENHDGLPYVVATIYNFLQKSSSNKDIEETVEKDDKVVIPSEEKAIVFHGSVEILNGKEHYTIWGCICTLKSKNPLVLIPEKNGIKTIIFEDKHDEAKSVHDLCQIYQNLYPNLPVYLLEKERIRNGKEHVFKENDYISFVPQEKKNTGSLLEVGKKVLTVDEMIEKRNKDLEILKKKNLNSIKTMVHPYYQTPISDEYKKKCPEDVSFINYIRALELAGLKKEHMQKTGLLDQIQKKMELNSEIETFTFDRRPSSKSITTLSGVFQKRFPIVKGMNDDILENIIKLEKKGSTPQQIILELHLPEAMIELLSKDIPNLRGNFQSEIVEKTK